MAAFHFRLASVLRLRQAFRDERRLELTEAESALSALDARLRQIERDLASVHKHFEVGLPGHVNLDRLRDADRYTSLLVSERHSILQQRVDLADEVERRRLAVVDADTDVRALEKLREAGEALHREELAQSEAKALDEIASMRHGRT